MFLGRSPQALNVRQGMEYLAGGEALFGSELSGEIATRASYAADAPMSVASSPISGSTSA